MPSTPSPLRYPGGKYSIHPMVTEVIKHNGLEKGHYAEPYAGGCGLALGLLFKGIVEEIHLNDLDRSIWSFWNAVVNDTDRFVDAIQQTPVTLDEWMNQREIQASTSSDDFEKAFAAFFLNRTNRSGVIGKAGVIGGLNQDGKYKIDCRFNKVGLIAKIRKIESYKGRVHLYNLDAVEFIGQADATLPERTFFCIDPPYYNKGATLYTNFYGPEDHQHLANVILNMDHPWILTYDDAPAIQRLYETRRQFRFSLTYSAAEKRKGTELLVMAPQLEVSPKLMITAIAA